MSAVKILREDPSSPDFDPLEQALHAWEIRRSDQKESHRIAQQLIEHALEFDNPIVTSWAYLTCGVHEIAANELDDADESLASAKRLFARASEQRGESLAIILQARVQMQRGQFHPALEMYKSIIEREAHGLQTLERFEAFNCIAGCFWGLDNVELCLLYLSRAFETLKNTAYNTERAAVLNNMGSALLAVGNHEAAEEFLATAGTFAKAGNDRVLQQAILSNTIACCIELGKKREALSAAVRIMSDYQDLLFSGPMNTALCNTAIAFAMGKQINLASQCLVGARIIAEESRLPVNQLQLAQAEANVAEAQGNFAVAAAQAESILANFGDHVSNEVRSQILALLITCYQRLSRLDDLLRVKKQRLSLTEGRYQAGLAAAMVILDLKASLKQLAT